ncbi:MAG: hypothetical protein LBB87_01725 [Nitrososphaerota archaeon]|jgi:hypothetical protein|nr:hypothetical protein [Nitrososphaerota archaeon]
MTDINIKESIEDKKSWFNIKRFKIGNTDFQKPEKCLDIKNLDNSIYRNIKTNFKFYEASKILKNYDNISKLTEAEDDQINKFFYRGEWLGTAQNVINLTLQFNPYNHVKTIDELSWFFNQYYPYSKLFLTVPNIRVKTLKANIIDLQSYTRFVDETYKILNDKNNKPIFVPVSMKFTIGQLTGLMEHYLKHDRFYYWFDFEGRSINENSLGRLRHIFDLLKKKKAFDNVVTYFSNVKREKTANSKENTSVASDALSAIAGANLIGVNREPSRYFNPNTLMNDGSVGIRASIDVDPNHKARIFDRETYYYVKTVDQDLYDKRKYVPLNAARLNAEFAAQSEYFLEHQDITTLLNQKSMFKDEKAGNILHDLTSKSATTSADMDMSDFF